MSIGVLNVTPQVSEALFILLQTLTFWFFRLDNFSCFIFQVAAVSFAILSLLLSCSSEFLLQVLCFNARIFLCFLKFLSLESVCLSIIAIL